MDLSDKDICRDALSKMYSLNFQAHLGLYKAYLLSVMCLYNML